MPRVNMAEKVCLVTGGNSGIGKSVALGLAKMGATVVVVSRNKEKGETAVTDTVEKSGNKNVELIQADMSACINSTLLFPLFSTVSVTAVSPFSLFRETTTTVAPIFANPSATLLPIPEFPPVTRHTFSAILTLGMVRLDRSSDSD